MILAIIIMKMMIQLNLDPEHFLVIIMKMIFFCLIKANISKVKLNNESIMMEIENLMIKVIITTKVHVGNQEEMWK